MVVALAGHRAGVCTCRSAGSGPHCPPGTGGVAAADRSPLGMALESKELSEI